CRRPARRRHTAPASHPSSREPASPSRILPQGPGRRLESPPGRARAAPDSPAARAWLSLVGTPNRHAAAAHTTMAHRAAHRAGRASAGDEPKSAISYSVSATEAFTAVITRAPSRLYAAASRAARRKDRAPAPTAAAMALGASVQPLTSTTASTRAQVRDSTGFWLAWEKRAERDKQTPPVPILRGQEVRYESPAAVNTARWCAGSGSP